jgi:hypothetical protein
MSKKPIWPIFGSPNPRVADPGFYLIREDGRDFSRCPIVIVEDVGMEQRLRYSAAVIRD